MADKSINQLPVSDGLTDGGLLVVYQNDETRSITGNLIKQFAKQGIESALEDAKASGEFDGKDGVDGTDGVSPTVAVADTTGGHRITITDVNGTQTVDVMDGTDGTDGDDGVSPTITVEAITGGHRLIITDATGTKTVDVMNGEDGADGAGAGDMMASDYDPQGKKQDVFAYVDNAVANMLTQDDLQAATDAALAQAKASGEFDGKDGQDGEDGYTPVKGTDYWTEADKTEMVNDVLAALPAAEGVSV